MGMERYNIRLKAADEALTRPDDLKAIYLRSSTGELVRLDALVKVQPALGPTLIARQNLQYAANLKGSPSLVLDWKISFMSKSDHFPEDSARH